MKLKNIIEVLGESLKDSVSFTLAQLVLVVAIIGLLAALALPAMADPPANVVKPRTLTLVSSQAITNSQTLTLNLSTNIYLTAASQHYLTFWGSSVSTNTAVAGTTTASLKFAYDPLGTNFLTTGSPAGAVLIIPNFATTNQVAATNIAPSVYDGATGVLLTTVTTTGTTNGANGGYTGQTVSLYLNQTP